MKLKRRTNKIAYPKRKKVLTYFLFSSTYKQVLIEFFSDRIFYFLKWKRMQFRGTMQNFSILLFLRLSLEGLKRFYLFIYFIFENINIHRFFEKFVYCQSMSQNPDFHQLYPILTRPEGKELVACEKDEKIRLNFLRKKVKNH